MNRTEISRAPIIHANLYNLERELQQLVGSCRLAERTETTRSGGTSDQASAHDTAIAEGD